jgi:uncharacterized membrane-anchored protein
MKNVCLSFLFLLCGIPVFSQDSLLLFKQRLDSIENSFQFQHGTIELSNGVGQIVVPAGFKYLDAKQAEHVLVDLWGNPKTENLTLGLLLPEKQKLISDTGYLFNIQYDEIGYVKDDDADEIDYDDLLEQMRKDGETENKERQAQGYEPVEFVGWASKPFYDKDKKILHWAKEIKFGDNEVNTLNYNVRVLGRKGVLVLNAIATMPNLPMVKKDIHHVLNIVQFKDGYQYKDFDPSVDEVAAWTIGGLVAGKVLAKVGFFAILLKFWKLIFIGGAAVVAGFWRRITGKKKEEEDDQTEDVEENAGAESMEIKSSENEAKQLEAADATETKATEPGKNKNSEEDADVAETIKPNEPIV